LNAALVQAFEQHQEQLLGFLNKRVDNIQLAEDLLHDLFLKIQSQPGDKDIAYPKAYLFRMANNLVIDKQRSKANQTEHQSIEDISLIDSQTPEQKLIHQQQLAVITDAINELPEKTKEAFKMQRLQELKKDVVADKLGISVNMVEKHLRRAVQYCRDKLKNVEN